MGISMQMTKSTSSFPASVENLRNQGSIQLTLPMTTMTSTDPPIRSRESSNLRCLGSPEKKMQDATETRIVRNHAESFTFSLETSKSSSNGFKPPELLPWVSQQANGTTLSKDKLSVSTQCSPHCTTFQLLKRMLDGWESLRSPSEEPNQQRKSKRVANGPAPGTPPSKQLNLLSLTGNLNLENMRSTSRDNSQQRSHLRIDKSSSTTSPSIMKSVEDRTHSSQTFTVSPDFILQSSYPMESNLSTQSSKTSTLPVRNQVQRLNSVTASTPLTVARTQLTTVVSDTPARNASDWVMGKNQAMSKTTLAHELHPHIC